VRAVAGCFALACFCVAIVSGMLADRPTDSVLFSAIVAMIVGQFVGLGAGAVISVALRECITDYTRRNPIPVEANMKPDTRPAERAA